MLSEVEINPGGKRRRSPHQYGLPDNAKIIDQDFNQYYFVKDDEIDLVFPLSDIKQKPKADESAQQPSHVKLKEAKIKKLQKTQEDRIKNE